MVISDVTGDRGKLVRLASLRQTDDTRSSIADRVPPLEGDWRRFCLNKATCHLAYFPRGDKFRLKGTSYSTWSSLNKKGKPLALSHSLLARTEGQNS